MDVLSDVVHVVRLSGAVFFTAEFSAPWAFDSPNKKLLAPVVMPEAECIILFHIAMEGDCLVECEGHPPIRMEAGDVIVFPHGDPHTMRSDEVAKAASLQSVFSKCSGDALRHVSFGGGGRKSRFLCGYLNCDQRFDPLVGALPTILCVRARDGYRAIEAVDESGRRPTAVPPDSGTWLSTTLKFTINEARAARPGNAAMLGRLTELMFVEILREYMNQVSAERGGWLAGLRDPHVGKALRLLHANPERDWTVERLAREAAISRSAFAQRFTELVGEAPMRYLAKWRMQLARQMLREGGHSVQEIAERIGYESEAAFSRAFKRAAGQAPVAWKKVARGALASALSTLMTALVGLAADVPAGLEALVC